MTVEDDGGDARVALPEHGLGACRCTRNEGSGVDLSQKNSIEIAFFSEILFLFCHIGLFLTAS